MMTHRSSGTPDERGFTLVELLIVTMILPLVVGAISVALVAVFSLQGSTAHRISGSGDAQVMSSVFVKDVQSADQITTQTSPQCGSAGIQLLGLKWSLSGGTYLTSVSYVEVQVTSGSATTWSLLREYCTGGNTATPSNTLGLSYDLNTVGTTVATCPTSVTDCTVETPYSWSPAQGVAALEFTVSEVKSAYTFTLYATPRVVNSSYSPGSGNPYTPLALLGNMPCTSPPTPILNVGNGILSINVGGEPGQGLLGMTSTCSGSVAIANNGQLLAGGVVTNDPGLQAIIPPGNSSNTIFPTTEANFPQPYQDPYSNVPTPTAPQKSAKGSCTYAKSDKTWTCTPGYFSAANTPAFTEPNTTIIFTGDGAVYDFAGEVNIPNGATVMLGSNALIFGGDKTSPPPQSLVTGNNITMTGSNALLYVETGAATFGNGITVNLTAGPSDPYKGITVWDAGATMTPTTTGFSYPAINPLTLGNVASGTYGGIYVPQGEVTVSEVGTIDATFIVAYTADFSNGETINITPTS